MFKEAVLSPLATQEPTRLHLPPLEFFASLMPFFLQLKERLPKFHRPEFNLWSSATYFAEQRLSLAEVQTFLDEYVGMFAVKEYPYGPYGIPDGDSQTLASERCQNHLRELAAAKLETTRAELEIWVAQSIEVWMATPNVPIGTKLVSISPRGTVKEGYPGEQPRNYVFVNVYEKVDPIINDTSFRLTQYLSYDTHTQLAELQAQLQHQLGATTYQPLSLPSQPQKLAHQLLTQLQELAPEVTLADIKTQVQTQAKTWPIQLSDLPALPLIEFTAQRQAIINYCQEQFTQLLESNSPEAAAEFDLLIKTVRTWFLKWAEVHATNYTTSPTPTDLFAQPDQLLINIDEAWQLALKTRQQTLTHSENQRLQQLSSQVKLSPLTPLFKLSSLAHCIVGTPGSLALKSINLNQLTALKVSGGISIERFSFAQKEELNAFIQELIPIQVLNYTTGRTEIYYLQLTDDQYAPDYQTGCYKKMVDGQEVIFGPCDVPLTEDGLVVEGSLMTENEHQHLLDNLAQLQMTEAENELMQNPELSAAEKDLVQRIFTILTANLFKTSLSNFVAGITEAKPLQLLTLPPHFWQTLTSSANPIPLLEQLLQELDLSQLLYLEESILSRTPHSISSPNHSIIGDYGRRSSHPHPHHGHQNPNQFIETTSRGKS